MKKTLTLALLSAALLVASADTPIDAMVRNCQAVMAQGVCRVQLDRADYPSSQVLIAGVGRISVDSYLKIRNSGDNMCAVVRDVCTANWAGDDCKAARALWRQQ